MGVVGVAMGVESEELVLGDGTGESIGVRGLGLSMRGVGSFFFMTRGGGVGKRDSGKSGVGLGGGLSYSTLDNASSSFPKR